MHIVFVYTEAEMPILHIIHLILLFPFVCEAVSEVEWKRGPELPPPYPYMVKFDHIVLLVLLFSKTTTNL